MRVNAKMYYITFLCLGAIMCIIACVDIVIGFLPEFLSGFLLSIGLIYMFISGIMISNKKIMKKLDVNANDERMIMIRGKAYGITYYIKSIAGIIVAVVCGELGMPYSYVTFAITGFMLFEAVIFEITKLVLSKKI